MYMTLFVARRYSALQVKFFFFVEPKISSRPHIFLPDLLMSNYMREQSFMAVGSINWNNILKNLVIKV